MMRKCKLLLGLAGGALIAAPAQAEPVKIGASLPMTGGLAINGQKHKDGYELCIDLINQAGGLLGEPVEIVISDNQSSNETAQAQFERLINEDDVDVLFGTFSSRLTFPTTSIAEQNRMVYPIPSGVALQIYERGYRYIFNFQPNAAEYVGRSYLGLMQDLVDPAEMPKKAAVVYADDFYANAVVAGLTGKKQAIAGTDKEIDLSPGAFAEAGIEVVMEQQWPEEGFADWITLANTIKGSGADMVVGYTASPDEAIQLIRALQTVDYQPQTVVLGQGTQTEFAEAVGEAAEGVMIHSAWHPAVEWAGGARRQAVQQPGFRPGVERAVRARSGRGRGDPVRHLSGDGAGDPRHRLDRQRGPARLAGRAHRRGAGQDHPRRLLLGRARPAGRQAVPDHPVAGRQSEVRLPDRPIPGHLASALAEAGLVSAGSALELIAAGPGSAPSPRRSRQDRQVRPWRSWRSGI